MIMLWLLLVCQRRRHGRTNGLIRTVGSGALLFWHGTMIVVVVILVGVGLFLQTLGLLLDIGLTRFVNG